MTGMQQQHGRPGGATLSRRQFVVAAVAGAASLALPARFARAALPGESVVLQWNDALLQGVRNSRPGPPTVARALAIAHTCMYDAWAAYDHRVVGTRLGGLLRRPPRERTLANMKQAVSVAAYRAAVDLFPGSTSAVFDPLMRELGYDASDRATDTSTPTGIGNVAASAVLDFHHRDGANQLGDEPGGRKAFRTPTTRITCQRTIRWTFASPSIRPPSTTRAHGSRCATSMAAETSSRRGSSVPSGST